MIDVPLRRLDNALFVISPRMEAALTCFRRVEGTVLGEERHPSRIQGRLNPKDFAYSIADDCGAHDGPGGNPDEAVAHAVDLPRTSDEISNGDWLLAGANVDLTRRQGVVSHLHQEIHEIVDVDEVV